MTASTGGWCGHLWPCVTRVQICRSCTLYGAIQNKPIASSQAHFAYGFMRMALVLLLNRQGIENLECRTLECWNMALNLMEPLVKTAIGRQELPFPAFFEILKPFRTRYALLHCQAIF